MEQSMQVSCRKPRAVQTVRRRLHCVLGEVIAETISDPVGQEREFEAMRGV